MPYYTKQNLKEKMFLTYNFLVRLVLFISVISQALLGTNRFFFILGFFLHLMLQQSRQVKVYLNRQPKECHQ